MAKETKEIQPIKSLDELEQGDVAKITGRIEGGFYVVAAIGDVSGHEREAVLHPIYCPECPDSHPDIRYSRVDVFEQQVLDSGIQLQKMRREDFKGWKYAGIKTIE